MQVEIHLGWGFSERMRPHGIMRSGPRMMRAPSPASRHLIWRISGKAGLQTAWRRSARMEAGERRRVADVLPTEFFVDLRRTSYIGHRRQSFTFSLP